MTWYLLRYIAEKHFPNVPEPIISVPSTANNFQFSSLNLGAPAVDWVHSRCRPSLCPLSGSSTGLGTRDATLLGTLTGSLLFLFLESSTSFLPLDRVWSSTLLPLATTLLSWHFSFATGSWTSTLKFDSHIASICQKVRRQVNALNRLKNVLPCKTKEALYRALILPHFALILPHFDYCSPIWHHCGARNTRKLERVNECVLRFVHKDKNNSCNRFLNWIGLHSTLEGRRIQDMLITINSIVE